MSVKNAGLFSIVQHDFMGRKCKFVWQAQNTKFCLTSTEYASLFDKCRLYKLVWQARNTLWEECRWYQPLWQVQDVQDCRTSTEYTRLCNECRMHNTVWQAWVQKIQAFLTITEYMSMSDKCRTFKPVWQAQSMQACFDKCQRCRFFRKCSAITRLSSPLREIVFCISWPVSDTHCTFPSTFPEIDIVLPPYFC